MESFASLSWLVWILVHKPLVADGVIYKPLVAYVDRRVHAFCGIRGSSFESPSWLTRIAVHKPSVADGVVYKPLVACVDRRLQAFGGRWSRLQAFGGIRGSSFTSIWWIAWIAVHKPFVAYMDRRVHVFGGIRGLSFTSLWWLAWIAVHKPLVADGVIYMPLVAYVDCRLQAFWWRTWIVV